MTQRAPFLRKNGDRVAVVRPADPARALAEARRLEQASRDATLSADELNRQFHAILDQQEYRFVGFAGVNGELLDKRGNVIGKMEPGDSMVAPDAIRTTDGQAGST